MKEDHKKPATLAKFLQNPAQAQNMLVLLKKLEALEAKWEKTEDRPRYNSAQ